MATLKYSKQREAIKDYLSSTYDHPTADTIYLNVKQKFPNISLGTIYRNLNLLTDLGEVYKISTPIGGDRFDGHTHQHYHFCCTHCGKVLDMEMDELKFVNETANKNFNGIVQGHSMMFYGICPDCLTKN